MRDVGGGLGAATRINPSHPTSGKWPNPDFAVLRSTSGVATDPVIGLFGDPMYALRWDVVVPHPDVTIRTGEFPIDGEPVTVPSPGAIHMDTKPAGYDEHFNLLWEVRLHMLSGSLPSLGGGGGLLFSNYLLGQTIAAGDGFASNYQSLDMTPSSGGDYYMLTITAPATAHDNELYVLTEAASGFEIVMYLRPFPYPWLTLADFAQLITNAGEPLEPAILNYLR